MLDIARAREYEELHVSRLGEHTRAFIKVQDGCNQFCSCLLYTSYQEMAKALREEICKPA